MQRLTYRELESRWKSLRGVREDVAVREVACVNAPRTLLCVDIGQPHLPCIALSAGVHGDEPAGPTALLDAVESDALDRAFSYRVWPCTNPTGYDAGTRASTDGIDINRSFGRGGQSPEARAIVTANRNRKFALAIDLHEDSDATGFYCYEYGGQHLGRAVVDAIAAAGCGVEEAEAIDGGVRLPVGALRERGHIASDPFAEAALLEGLSYSLLVARHAAAHVLTLETPSSQALVTRVAMQTIALQAAIRAFSQGFHK